MWTNHRDGREGQLVRWATGVAIRVDGRTVAFGATESALHLLGWWA